MILITGATGHTGQFLLRELFNNRKDYQIRCLVRRNSCNLERIAHYNVEIAYGDMEDEESIRKAIAGVNTVIHTANIRYSPQIARISGETEVKRIIFIHTAGIYSKFRAYTEEYRRIESEIIEKCRIDFTILRPTMIYGTVQDHNMHKLIHYIKNHNIFPVFGSGKGLMQPVHARDLAKAVVLVLENPKTFNKVYNISGGSALKYKEILSLIAGKVNPKTKFIYIPYRLSLLSGIFYSFLFYLLGKKGQISIEQIKRLNENKNFSYEEAAKDFGYAPVAFETGIEEEIKSMGF